MPCDLSLNFKAVPDQVNQWLNPTSTIMFHTVDISVIRHTKTPIFMTYLERPNISSSIFLSIGNDRKTRKMNVYSNVNIDFAAFSIFLE